jgi:hypothetical protein
VHKSGQSGDRVLRVVVRQKRDDVTGGCRKLGGGRGYHCGSCNCRCVFVAVT